MDGRETNIRLIEPIQPAFLGKVCKRRREMDSAYRKMARRRIFVPEKEIPEHSQKIEMTDFDDTGMGTKFEQFFQYESKKQKVFYLESELHLLRQRNWFVDGTFFLLKNLSYLQVYIISVLYEENNQVYVYPVVFSFHEQKDLSTYNEFFSVLNDRFKALHKTDLVPSRLD